MKKNILIVGFYELKEHLQHICELFEGYGYSVHNYPLFKFAYDMNERIENYCDHMGEYIGKENIDVVIWWFLDVPVSVFRSIKRGYPSIYYILFNIDDPINFNSELTEKAKIFNLVITPCKSNVSRYKLFSGVKDVIYLPHSYDGELFYKMDNIEYISDISMVMYEVFEHQRYNNAYISTHKMILNLIHYCLNSNKKLRLYGSFLLRELYGSYYEGDIDYLDQNSIFNRSKINIVLRHDKALNSYIKPIEVKILASGGLLCIDRFDGMDIMYKDKYNCIVLDRKDYIHQIDSILADYKFDDIKSNACESVSDFTWSKWVLEVHKKIMSNYFDADVYMKINNILISREAAWEHWLNEGLRRNLVCYKFNVPPNFNCNLYRDLNGIADNSAHSVYYHWFLNSGDKNYLDGKKGIQVDAGKLNCTVEDYYEVCTIINKINEYSTLDSGLIKLTKKCGQCPHIKINEIIVKYFSGV
jgi:hypothetical protein